MTTDTREKCWTKGCEEPRSDERNGYWCTRHHDERRERITRGMAQIANDSMGIPRNHGGTGEKYVAPESPGHRCIGITKIGERCKRTGNLEPDGGGFRCRTHRDILS